MSQKEIELLKSRIEKLDAKDFDLEAWKNYTIVILERIFGTGNQKIEQIKKIHYDYGSWSLRDTSGYSSYLDTCKKLSREILEASISELETFGAPDLKSSEQKQSESIKTILNALEEELKVSQFKEIRSIANSDKEIQQKQKEIEEKLKTFGNEVVLKILSAILAGTTFPGD